MATNKNLAMNKQKKKTNDDAVVYKVMLALVLGCCALIGLRSLGSYFRTVEGSLALRDYGNTIAIAGLALAIVSAAITIFWKNAIARGIAPWFLAAGLIVAVTGRFLRFNSAEEFSFLYYLCFATMLQYIVFQLYRWEFFLFSLSTVTAGCVFFTFSKGIYWTARNISLLVVLTLVLLATTYCCHNACKNKGFFKFRGIRTKFYGAKSAPALLYIVNILWLICTVCIPMLGGLFAYYCIFAAVAVEFIAAVYYTFQLN